MIHNDMAVDRPQVLGSLDYRLVDGAKDEITWKLNSCHDLRQGSLESFQGLEHYPVLDHSIRSLAASLGCSSLEKDHPDGSGILPVVGSVHSHKDNLPILLTWAAYVDYRDYVPYPKPELICGGYCLKVSPGEIFIFDPQQEHAWPHNGTAVFVQLPVKVSERTFNGGL